MALQIFENRIIAQSIASIVVFLTFVTVLSPLVSNRSLNIYCLFLSKFAIYTFLVHHDSNNFFMFYEQNVIPNI